MGEPLYNNPKGMSQSSGLPGGHTTSRSGGRGYGGYGRPTTAKIAPSGGRSGGLSNALSGMTGGNMPVSQPIQPVQMAGNLQGSRSKNIAYASLGLKGIANVMQAIENYKAAQNALIIAQEERDIAAEDKAREQMEKSKTSLIGFTASLSEMGEAEQSSMAQAITQAASKVLDEQSMDELNLAIGSEMGSPSEAEAAGKKALTEKQSGKYGELTGGAIALAGLTPEDVAKMPPEKLRKYVQEYLVSTKAGGNTNTTNVNLGKTPPGAVEAQTINGAFLKRLKRIKDGFKPEYVGAWMGGDLDGWATKFKSATGQLSPEAATWFAEVAGVKNMKIKIQSGATVPVGEVPRLMEEITSVMDSDVGFTAKLGVMETVAMEEMGVYAANLEAGGYLPVGGNTGGGTAQPEPNMSVDLPYPIEQFEKNRALINELTPQQKIQLKNELLKRGQRNE